MTPERAEYHRIMLMVGLRDKFDQEFDWALENEDPLSDIILSLTSCASDIEETIAVLHSFALDNDFDEEEVYALVLDDIRSRYLHGELSRAEVAQTLYSIATYLDKCWDEPWDDFLYLSYDLEEYEDGLISETEFIQRFDAWFLRGEPVRIFATKERFSHYTISWKHFVAMMSMIALSFIAIGITVALTGARDIGEFTQQDWIIFNYFALSELVIWGLALIFAKRCGKMLYCRSDAELAIVAAHKNDGLDRLPYPCVKVIFETNGIRRALIQSWDGYFCVTIDRFFFDTQTWHPVALQSNLESMQDVEVFLLDEDFVFSGSL